MSGSLLQSGNPLLTIMACDYCDSTTHAKAIPMHVQRYEVLITLRYTTCDHTKIWTSQIRFQWY